METRQRVIEFIVNNYLFGDDSRVPADSESLLESGIIDSTGILELIEFLEADLGISVAEDETVPENLDSIANLTAFVERKSGS
jgi:acyl carrier protein